LAHLNHIARVALPLLAVACNLQITGDGSLLGVPGAASSDDAPRIDAGVVLDSALPPPPPRVDPASPSGPIDASAEAAPPIDANDANDANAVDPCDRDGDGHRATGACGGDDCCDQDPVVFPGQQNFFASVSACGTFDYDCDGKPSPRFERAACHVTSFQCIGDGFGGDVQCGEDADFFTCDFAGLLCVGKKGKKVVQLCR
jgi:hypothetical protein